MLFVGDFVKVDDCKVNGCYVLFLICVDFLGS